MDTHKNAPLTPKGREAMVRRVIEGGLTKAAAALQFNVTAKTVAKWVKRFRAEGVDGLRDRSSRPHSLPSQTAAATRWSTGEVARSVAIGIVPPLKHRYLRGVV
jgi:transposase